MKSENRRLAEEIADLLQEIEVLKRANENCKRAYEQNYKQSIKAIKRSRTWLAGSLLIFPLSLIVTMFTKPFDFFKNPFTFFRRQFRKNFSDCIDNLEGKDACPGIVSETDESVVSSGSNKDNSISKACSDNYFFKQGEPGDFPVLGCAGKLLKDINVAAVVDEFTSACFGEDVRLIHVTPGTIEDAFDKNDIDLLFVESAWHGRHNSWDGIIPFAERPESAQILKDLTAAAARHGVPSAFWGKEDPPDYEIFKNAARHFDIIFTSDSNMIPHYSKDLGRSRVYSLPFAAQPTIHNPLGKTEEPGKDLLFAGTWYKRHKARLDDYERVLDPALNFSGFHIYDRMFDSPKVEIFGFPDRFKPFIKGKLSYHSLVKEYKKYKLFLNVNSVQHSPTMFSRRVYEALLSGTPVISGYSEGIERLIGSDIVQLVRTPEEGLCVIQDLLDDTGRREMLSRLGIRKVMEEHTFEERLRDILHIAGVSYRSEPEDIAVWSLVRSGEELKTALDNFGRQAFRAEKLRFYLVTPDVSLASAVSLPSETTILKSNPGEGYSEALDRVRLNSKESCLALLDVDGYYSSHYLMDMYHALSYSGCGMAGKSGYIFYDEDRVQLKEQNPPDTFLGNKECDLASSVFERSFPVRVQKKGPRWVLKTENRRWYSYNPYGLIRHRDASRLELIERESLGSLGNWML